jgi:hypothetical protein
VKAQQREYWNVLTNGGELADRMKRLASRRAAMA